jgi:hypothetical protein
MKKHGNYGFLGLNDYFYRNESCALVNISFLKSFDKEARKMEI